MQLPEPLKQDLKHQKVFTSINLLYWKMPLPMAGALDWMIFKGPFQYKLFCDSVIHLNISAAKKHLELFKPELLCFFFVLLSFLNQPNKIQSYANFHSSKKWGYIVIYSLVLSKTQRKKKYVWSIQCQNKELYSPFLIPHHLKYIQKNSSMENKQIRWVSEVTWMSSLKSHPWNLPHISSTIKKLINSVNK